MAVGTILDGALIASVGGQRSVNPLILVPEF